MKRQILPLVTLAALTGWLFSTGEPLGPGKGNAQGNLDQGEELLPENGAIEFEKAVNNKDNKNTFDRFVAGKESPNEQNKKHVDIIKNAAMWLTYRLTWRDYLQSNTATKSVQKVMDDFDNVLKTAAGAKTQNAKFMALFVPQLATNLQEVLSKGRLQPKIKATMLLTRLCQTGRQELVGNLVGILNSDKIHPAFKLYALKGMKELLAQRPALAVNAAPAEIQAYNDRYTKAFTALVKYLDDGPKITKDTPAFEKDRLNSVHIFFRLEAIRALAEFRVPALAVDKTSKKVQAPVAYKLVEVAANEGLTPKASLSEQVEAAVGLLNMRASVPLPYNLNICMFVTASVFKELAIKYNEEVERIGSSSGKTDKSEPKKIRKEPWRIHAARLYFAMEELEQATVNKQDKEKVTFLREKVKAILEPIKLQPKPKRLGDSEISILDNAVQKLKPTKFSMYSGIDGYKLKFDE